jgi:hypothetical protein
MSAWLDWEWLREREYLLRASALANDSCCSWSTFFKSRIRSNLVGPRRFSIVYSRERRRSMRKGEAQFEAIR